MGCDTWGWERAGRGGWGIGWWEGEDVVVVVVVVVVGLVRSGGAGKTGFGGWGVVNAVVPNIGGAPAALDFVTCAGEDRSTMGLGGGGAETGGFGTCVNAVEPNTGGGATAALSFAMCADEGRAAVGLGGGGAETGGFGACVDGDGLLVRFASDDAWMVYLGGWELVGAVVMRLASVGPCTTGASVAMTLGFTMRCSIRRAAIPILIYTHKLFFWIHHSPCLSICMPMVWIVRIEVNPSSSAILSNSSKDNNLSPGFRFQWVS